MTPPCRCLLGDFPEGKELAELIADYVASLPEEFRAAPEEISRRLNEAKVWIEAFEPFREARAELGRRDGATVLALDLGLSGAAASARMPAP